MVIKIGSLAPDFNLTDQNGEKITLSQYRGEKDVILSWHVFDFTGGWTNQVSSFNRFIGSFEEISSQVLGISTDSHHSHRAWSNALGGVKYPLLADFCPQGEMTNSYGLLNKKIGAPLRAIVIVDKKGIVRFSKEYPPGSIPDPSCILNLLATFWSVACLPNLYAKAKPKKWSNGRYI